MISPIDEKIRSAQTFVLVVIACVVLDFHTLELVPQVENIAFAQVAVLDLAELVLRAWILLTVWNHYGELKRRFSDLYERYFLRFPGTKSDLRFVLEMIRFGTLVFVYKLTVPSSRVLLTKAGSYQPWMGVAVDVLFILGGGSMLRGMWRALQAVIADFVTAPPMKWVKVDEPPKEP